MVDNVITVDFDGTIGDYFDGTPNPRKSRIRNWIKILMRRGYDVHIVTRRFGPNKFFEGAGDEHVKVLKFAEELEISFENVHFTNREWKYKTLITLESSVHLDDDMEEKMLIKENAPDITAICVEDGDWEEELIERLSKNNGLNIWLSKSSNVERLSLTIGAILLMVVIML
jgi:hypothetical protein